MIKTINLIILLFLHFYKESTMCGSFLTQLISFLSPGVPMLHVKPESRLKCQLQRGKMLLGTFKTVFNSVFLVPTKTNTPHHMAKMERCCVLKEKRERECERDEGREIERRRRDVISLHQQRLCSGALFLTQGQDWLGFNQQGWSAIG